MNKRVFIGPIEIAGYYANLAQGFREIGIDCDYITYRSHLFGYGGETRPPALLRVAQFFNSFRKPNRSFAVKVLVALPGEVLQNIWGLWAIFRYDVLLAIELQNLIRFEI